MTPKNFKEKSFLRCKFSEKKKIFDFFFFGCKTKVLKKFVKKMFFFQFSLQHFSLQGSADYITFPGFKMAATFKIKL